MELSTFERKETKKSVAKRLRIEGKIPAILYAKEKASEPLFVNLSDFEAILRSIPKGRLATALFTLKDEKGNQRKAMVKEIQYHRTSYHIIHLDFYEVNDKEEIKINVPVICQGEDECAGVKQGGIFRQVIRAIPVKALPKAMPKEFYVDVVRLNVGDVVRVSDISFPQNVTPLAIMHDVVITIGKR